MKVKKIIIIIDTVFLQVKILAKTVTIFVVIQADIYHWLDVIIIKNTGG